MLNALPDFFEKKLPKIVPKETLFSLSKKEGSNNPNIAKLLQSLRQQWHPFYYRSANRSTSCNSSIHKKNYDKSENSSQNK